MAQLWVTFLISVTIFQMLLRIFGTGLHDGEFIAVVTTTTASVFGFWWLVGRYLFPAPPEKNNDSEPKNLLNKGDSKQ